jgi:hypothetical protein
LVFVGCLCGYPKTHGLHCHHMVVVVKSYCIEGINSVYDAPLADDCTLEQATSCRDSHSMRF